MNGKPMPPQQPGGSEICRLTIYIGEDKMEVDQPLFKAIVQEARAMRIAGATVFHGSAGYGRSTRLHTSDVLFSTDLPVVVEILDYAQKLEPLIKRLAERKGIGLMVCETVQVCGPQRLDG
jgi:PII-like signaling protein